jgi:hypothetical protein
MKRRVDNEKNMKLRKIVRENKKVEIMKRERSESWKKINENMKAKFMLLDTYLEPNECLAKRTI